MNILENSITDLTHLPDDIRNNPNIKSYKILAEPVLEREKGMSGMSGIAKIAYLFVRKEHPNDCPACSANNETILPVYYGEWENVTLTLPPSMRASQPKLTKSKMKTKTASKLSKVDELRNAEALLAKLQARS